MQVLYGTPLPPGLVAPTRGELRLRVDQLLLDDDAINHNPAVRLFDTDEADVDHRPSSSAVAAAAPAVRSPNRFVVPVDYCAVGPIFWGETRPTAHGQPSTPQTRRGPLIMAYPIKIAPKQFAAYLQRMTASPQRGVQLDVFVPSSYSGRPPVMVGRARVTLDMLQPSHPVQGWFPVVHRRARPSSSAATRQLSRNSETASAADVSDGGESAKEVVIGKVKLSVSVEYYPTTRHVQDEPPSTKHRRHVEVSDNAPAVLPNAKTRRSHGHHGRTSADAAQPATESSSSSAASSTPHLLETAVKPVRVRGSHRLRLSSSNAGNASTSWLSRDRMSLAATSTQQLLQQGLRLRAQMDAAARGLDLDLVLQSQPEQQQQQPPSESNARNSQANGLDMPFSTAAADLHPAAYQDAGDGDDSTAYTSEDSDEENFAVQLQRDLEARDRRSLADTQQPRAPPQPRTSSVSETPDQQLSQLQRSSATARASAAAEATATSALATNAHVSVELCFSRFSFAQTPLTENLRQLRINVRLSSDITTTEPSSGPLSSFVHPVPFQQPSICLHFDVCSFSADRSKLVVEAYKVIAETELESEADAWDVRGPRQVAREELLGLAVVGLYRQSREVVFRDPVEDSSNVLAQLDIHMGPSPAEVEGVPNSNAMVNGVAAPHHATPASDSVPLSSIGMASLTPPPPQRVDKGVDSPPPNSLAPLTSPEQPSLRHAVPALPAAAAAATPPRAMGDPTASFTSVIEHRRLRVVVHSGAELPRVALAAQGRSGAARFPLVTSSPRAFTDAGIAGPPAYAEPSTFVTIEEVFRTAANVLSRHESRVGSDESLLLLPPRSRARMQPIGDWYVDEARGGYYDRSAVAELSSSPEYGYEVVLQLPEVTLSGADESAMHRLRKTAALHSSVAPSHSTAGLLEELQVNLWHFDAAHHAAQETHTNSCSNKKPRGGVEKTSPPSRQQEEQFWACVAYMGTCHVDLRPLQYLPVINGYYRVVCERTPSTAVDLTPTDAEERTIGYIRISVSLL